MRIFPLSRNLIALSGALTIMFAGCGGGGGGGSSSVPVANSNGQQAAQGPNGWVASSGPGVTWQLQAGGDRQDGALQALAMLPETITIDEGDSVEWTVQGEVHTITFLGSFTSPPGDPTVPQGGSTYDGTQFLSSGILPIGAHYKITFTKAGTYPYFCVLHAPEMHGTIVVQPRGTAYPRPQGFYTGTGTSTLNSILSEAMDAVKAIPYAVGGTHLAAGTSGPLQSNGLPSQATVLRFLDGDRLNLTSVTIPVGTTLTWTNLSNNEPHTVTFPVAGQPLPPLPGDPFTPPSGGSTYDGSAVTNSGVMNPGDSYHLTFTKAGTYVYFCLFHDEFGMMGTVVVK
jgi:plastocyanin